LRCTKRTSHQSDREKRPTKKTRKPALFKFVFTGEKPEEASFSWGLSTGVRQKPLSRDEGRLYDGRYSTSNMEFVTRTTPTLTFPGHCSGKRSAGRGKRTKKEDVQREVKKWKGSKGI